MDGFVATKNERRIIEYKAPLRPPTAMEKNSGCYLFDLIYPHSDDTNETKKQAERHNIKYEQICLNPDYLTERNRK